MDKAKKKPSSLFFRFALGVPLGTITVCVLAFGNVSLLVAAIVTALLALREFWRTTGVSHPGTLFPLSRLGDIATVVLLTASYIWPHGSFAIFIAIMIPIFALHQLIAVSRGAKEFLKEIATVTFGVLYAGGLLSFGIKLHHLQTALEERAIDPVIFTENIFQLDHVFYLAMFPVLVGFGSDSAALFAGKYFGVEKLAPKISPKKTIAGLVGGMVGNATSVTLFGYLIGLIGQIQVWEFILFGVISAAVSQLGDLMISALKREAHQKDMGRLLGAHGGMLDRIDGFIFTLPATYLFFLIVLS